MRDKRDQAYKDIETQLGVSVAAVKAKIVNLRSQLGREISKCNKIKSGQGVNEVYKPSWAFWDKLQFLRPVMQAGKSRDNLRDKDASDDASQSASLDTTTDGDTSIEVDEIQPSISQQGNLSTRQTKKMLN